jgi:DNA ligase-4
VSSPTPTYLLTDQRGEGLVVKKLDCTYSTNSRGADWVKVKPE